MSILSGEDHAPNVAAHAASVISEFMDVMLLGYWFDLAGIMLLGAGIQGFFREEIPVYVQGIRRRYYTLKRPWTRAIGVAFFIGG